VAAQPFRHAAPLVVAQPFVYALTGDAERAGQFFLGHPQRSAGAGSVRVCLLLGNTQQRARHPVGDAIEDGLMQQDGVAPQPPPQHH
jgi:hypothetical protein